MIGGSGALEPSTLYVVATPIGNLGDLTLRAIDTLRACDRVLAEDTRRARGLLSHLGIAGKPVDRLDTHASPRELERAAAHVLAGESVALVTDAGTPVVSDPGTALVAEVLRQGGRVVPLPGPSAVLTALAASGLESGSFRFVGFLPRSGEPRRQAVARMASDPEVQILFESPNRIAETLVDLSRAMPKRAACVGRELTKKHEEFLRGPLAELAELGQGREWLGELTLVLGADASAGVEAPVGEAELDARIDAALAEGQRAKDVAERLSVETGKPRREVYQRVLARREQQGREGS